MSISNDEWKAAAAEAEAFEKAQAKLAGKPEPKEEPKPAPEPEATEPDDVDTDADTEPAAKPDKEEPAADDDEPGDVSKPVYNKERLAFRNEKREERRKLAEERQRLIAEVEREKAAIAADKAGIDAAKRALEVGDPDGLAKALGYKDWTTLAQTAMETTSSPGYRRLRQVERELEEKRQAEAKARDEYQTRAQQEAQARAIAEHRAGLTKELKSLPDDMAVEFADDPAFIDMVFREQQKEWDGHETISAEEAAARALELIAQEHARLRPRFDKRPDHAIVKKFLSRRQAENDESSPRELANPESRGRERENHGKPKPKPSHSRPSEAGRSRDESHDEWRRATIEALKKSG